MAVNQIKRNGSYAPLSAHYYKDDAIAEAGPMAELLYVRGLAFCADVLSDGFISEMQLTRFVGVGIPKYRTHAERLVLVGLWEKAEPGLFGTEGTGFIVKSWPKWNLTKAEIQEKARKDADRKAGGGK
jgi:hypothetical protein